jgi:two-component system response regulator MprA
MRIPIVEDDRKMASLIRRALEESGHSVRVVYNGLSGLEVARTRAPDAVVLDIMLPGIDGFDFTRRLRREGVAVPILMLTGRDAVSDIVKGLNAGADDYLTKPFSLKILIARLDALLRRASATPMNRLHIASSIKINLTRTEFDILALLMRRTGRVVTRSALIEAVWGESARQIENNTLDAFMRLLRKKLEITPSKRLIHTVRGIGYTIREPE